MPKILPLLPDSGLDFNYNLTSLRDDATYAAHGIADIHEHYGMAPKELAKGSIKDLLAKKVYQANSGLTSEELEIIANQAIDVHYIAGYINWMKAIIDKATEEDKPSWVIHRYM